MTQFMQNIRCCSMMGRCQRGVIWISTWMIHNIFTLDSAVLEWQLKISNKDFTVFPHPSTFPSTTTKSPLSAVSEILQNLLLKNSKRLSNQYWCRQDLELIYLSISLILLYLLRRAVRLATDSCKNARLDQDSWQSEPRCRNSSIALACTYRYLHNQSPILGFCWGAKNDLTFRSDSPWLKVFSREVKFCPIGSSLKLPYAFSNMALDSDSWTLSGEGLLALRLSSFCLSYLSLLISYSKASSRSFLSLIFPSRPPFFSMSFLLRPLRDSSYLI